MSESEQIVRFKRLDLWFETPLGQNAAKAFCEAISHMDNKPHGDTLLQLGLCDKSPWLEKLTYTRFWIVSSQKILRPYSVLHALCHKLPLDRNSVDCVLAPFTIHAYKQYDNLLDEIDRVLKPMGRVIFFGINPLSLWGLWLKCSKHACFGRSHGYAHSLLSLKHAMLMRDYTAISASVFHYIPPVQHAYWLDKMQWFNQIGNMIAPMPSAFYCLVMQKNVSDYLLTRIQYAPLRVNLPLAREGIAAPI